MNTIKDLNLLITNTCVSRIIIDRWIQSNENNNDDITLFIFNVPYDYSEVELFTIEMIEARGREWWYDKKKLEWSWYTF